MASRTIKVVIEMKGQSKVHKQINETKLETEKLRRAIARQSLAAKALKTDTNKLAASTQKMGFIQKRLTASYLAGNIAARAISQAVSGLARIMSSGVGAAIDFEFTIAKIGVISGVSEKQLDSLQKRVREIARVSPKTAVEVGEAALSMSKMGLAGRDLENALSGVVNLSVALDEEVSSVGETVLSVATVFNKSSSEMTTIVDQMFTAFGNSKLTLDKFSTAFAHAGVSAKLAGVSFEDMLASMAILSDAGVKASTIGTQQRQIYTRLSDSGSKLSGILGEQSLATHGYSSTMRSLAPILKRGTKLQQILGIRAIPIASIMANNADAMDILKDKIVSLEKVSADAAKTLNDDTTKGRIKELGSAFTELSIVTGDFWKPFLDGLTEVGIGVIGLFTKLTSATNKLFKNTAEVLGEDGAAFDFSGNFEKLKKEFGKAGQDVGKAFNTGLDEFIKGSQAPLSGAAGNFLSESMMLAKGIADPTFNITAAAEARSKKDDAAKARVQAALDKEKNKEGSKKKKSTDVKSFLVKDNSFRASFRAKELIEEKAHKAALEVMSSAAEEIRLERFGEGSAREIEDSRLKMESLLTQLGQGHALTEEAQQQHKDRIAEINKKAGEEETQAMVANILKIGSATGNLVSSLGRLSQVRTDNAVKAAEAEGASEEDIHAIRKKGFEEQQKYQSAITALNTATAIMQIWADPTLVGNIPMKWGLSALVGATGLAQLGAINSQKFASGFDGQVTQPTMFMAGEEGPEDVLITPKSKTGSSGGSGGDGMTIVIQGDIYGEDQFIQRVRTANEEIDRRSS